MYRVSFHLVSIVLGLALAANLPIELQHNATTRSSRREMLLNRVGVTLCRDFPGLSREQSAACLKHPLETAVALQGLKLAVSECQYQFRWNRWNCSTLRGLKNRNPHSAPLLKKGYRESAFGYAISAAGVMQAVSRACGLGILPNCGCGEERVLHVHVPPDESEMLVGVINEEDNETSGRKRREHMSRSKSRGQWQWSGCAHNLQVGMQFSELFLDSREKGGTDLQSKVNLHNNKAGRMAVNANTLPRCKCHGLSGSCEIKTCWRSTPEFRRVGDSLKAHFRSAVMVGQGNLGRRGGNDDLEEAEETDNSVHESVAEMLSLKARLKVNRKNERRRKRRQGGFMWRSSRKQPETQDLLYFQQSPNFCDGSDDFPGTTGRRCHKNSSGNDGCASMCCGRGYNLIRVRKTEKCKCRFEWCCHVACENCPVEEWLTVCK